MSLFSSIFKGAKRLVGKVAPIASLIPGPIGAVAKGATIALGAGAAARAAVRPSVQGTLPMTRAVTTAGLGGLPALLSKLPAVLPGAGRTLGGAAVGRAVSTVARSGGVARIGRAAARAAGYIVTGSLIYDAAGNLIGNAKPSRRMNPMNYKAAVRAARRVKSAHKLLKKIDKLCGGGRRKMPRVSGRKR